MRVRKWACVNRTQDEQRKRSTKKTVGNDVDGLTEPKTEFFVSSSRSESTRKRYSKQGRLDTERIDQIPLNPKCRDEIIPILNAVQQLYSKPEVCEQVLKLVAQAGL